jgi:hypothetical protein
MTGDRATGLTGKLLGKGYAITLNHNIYIQIFLTQHQVAHNSAYQIYGNFLPGRNSRSGIHNLPDFNRQPFKTFSHVFDFTPLFFPNYYLPTTNYCLYGLG